MSFAAALFAASSAAAAADKSLWPENLQLHGFLSQGLVTTSANHFYGDSTHGSWDLREIGVNLSYRARPEWLFSGQLLSRTAGDLSDGEPRIDYALLDYTPIMTPALSSGLRIGRLKNPLGLYNDTRDMPFTRPSIFLPQSIYFDKVRNMELAVDGIGLYSDWRTSKGDFLAQFYAGQLNLDANVEYAFLNFNGAGKLTTDHPFYLGRIMYESDGGALRLAYSYAWGELDYNPAANDLLRAGHIEVDFWVASAQYNTEYWSLSAEWSREPLKWRDFGLYLNDRTAQGEGLYLQGQYRLTTDWQLLLRYDINYTDTNHRSGTAPAAASGLAKHNFYAKDWTFGLRWDINSAFMLQTEYHRIQGTSWLSAGENDLRETQKNWDMFALLAAFRF
jgi:hypothetical protein